MADGHVILKGNIILGLKFINPNPLKEEISHLRVLLW